MSRPSVDARKSVLEPTVPADIGARSQRQRIIDAMIESCAEKTYAATTIADIVRHASISRTTFYKRFSGKRECFDVALDWCIELLRNAAAGAHTEADPPAQAVRKGVTATIELMAARPALAQLVAGEANAVEPTVIERYRKLLIPALAELWDRAGAPQRPRTDPRLAFGRAQVLILGGVIDGGGPALTGLLPEIVYLAVLPFAGHEEARRQAKLAEPESDATPVVGDG